MQSSARLKTTCAQIFTPPEIYKENMKKSFIKLVVNFCYCISIKYENLEQRIPHRCIKVTEPERNSCDHRKNRINFYIMTIAELFDTCNAAMSCMSSSVFWKAADSLSRTPSALMERFINFRQFKFLYIYCIFICIHCINLVDGG